MSNRLESNLGFVSSVFTDVKSNRHFISCLFICSVVVPISLLAQTVPTTSPISGSREVCEDENSIYSVNTDPSIIINEVKFDGTSGQDQIELKNVGVGEVDLTGYRLCTRFIYPTISSGNAVSGDLLLSSGEIVVIGELNLNDVSADVGLYLPGTSNFGDQTKMVHFMQYEGSNIGRESVAVAKGIWVNDAFIDVGTLTEGETVNYDNSGINITDWKLATSSLGTNNLFSTSYDWSVPTGAMISNNNGNSITINWSGAESGNVSVTETNGDGGVGSVNLAVTVNQLVAWYVDSDGDGFGDPNSTPVMSCDEIAGSASNDDDCDDNNAEVTIEQTWHRDVDGDGFGDPNDPTASCTQPVGFVLNGTDCDDNNDQVPASPTISILSGELTTGLDGIHTWIQDGITLENQTPNSILPVEGSVYQVQTTINSCTSDLSIEFQFLITGVEENMIESILVFPTVTKVQLVFIIHTVINQR